MCVICACGGHGINLNKVTKTLCVLYSCSMNMNVYKKWQNWFFPFRCARPVVVVRAFLFGSSRVMCHHLISVIGSYRVTS